MKTPNGIERDELIGRIRQMVDEGASYQQIADALNGEGLRNKKGEPWKGDSLRMALDRASKRKAKVNPVPQEDLANTTQYDNTLPVPQANQVESEHKNTSPIPQSEIGYDDNTCVLHPDRGTSEPQEVVCPGLDAETMAVLREVAKWWRQRPDKESPARHIPEGYRPQFKGKRLNSSVRINENLMEAAREKAKTGISPLLERLLWAYLEHDPKFLR